MTKPLQITLVGYGKMGKTIKRLTEEDGSISIHYVIDVDTNRKGSAFSHSAFLETDVVIDFSHASAVRETIKACLEAGKPIVMGTTGWLEHLEEVKNWVKHYNGKLIYGSNFSLGVQLFNKLMKQAAHLYGNSPLFDAALHEVHHTQKADAPSGTALTLAKTYVEASTKKSQIKTQIPDKEKVNPNAFYVTAQRLGSVFGEHELRIQSLWDDIVIKHTARNRDGFAAGALFAAKWLTQKAESGFYLLEDVAEEVILA